MIEINGEENNWDSYVDFQNTVQNVEKNRSFIHTFRREPEASFTKVPLNHRNKIIFIHNFLLVIDLNYQVSANIVTHPRKDDCQHVQWSCALQKTGMTINYDSLQHNVYLGNVK